MEVMQLLILKCNETNRHIKVRPGEHTGVSSLTFKKSEPSANSLCYHMLPSLCSVTIIPLLITCYFATRTKVQLFIHSTNFKPL